MCPSGSSRPQPIARAGGVLGKRVPAVGVDPVPLELFGHRSARRRTPRAGRARSASRVGAQSARRTAKLRRRVTRASESDESRACRRGRRSAHRPPTGSVSLSRHVAERQAGVDRQRRSARAQCATTAARGRSRCRCGPRSYPVNVPEQDRALPREHAAEVQLVEHPLDPVRALADVLEEQDAAVDPRESTACPTRCATSARLPPHSVPRRVDVGTVERAVDLVALACRAAPSSGPSVNADGYAGAEVVRRPSAPRRSPCPRAPAPPAGTR